MYFTYCQLWIPLVAVALWDDFVVRREMRWAKTERYEVTRRRRRKRNAHPVVHSYRWWRCGYGALYWRRTADLLPVALSKGRWETQAQVGRRRVAAVEKTGCGCTAVIDSPGARLATLFLHGNAATSAPGRTSRHSSRGSAVLMLDYRGLRQERRPIHGAGL